MDLDPSAAKPNPLLLPPVSSSSSGKRHKTVYFLTGVVVALLVVVGVLVTQGSLLSSRAYGRCSSNDAQNAMEALTKNKAFVNAAGPNLAGQGRIEVTNNSGCTLRFVLAAWTTTTSAPQASVLYSFSNITVASGAAKQSFTIDTPNPAPYAFTVYAGYMNYPGTAYSPANPVVYTAQLNNGATGTPFDAMLTATAPSALPAGSPLTVRVVVKNTGTKPLTNAKFQLARVDAATGLPLTTEAAIGLPSTQFEPNSEWPIEVAATAPAQNGPVTYAYRLVDRANGAPLGFIGTATVTVTQAAGDAAACIETKAPTAAQVGKFITATYLVKNTGTTTWTSQGGTDPFLPYSFMFTDDNVAASWSTPSGNTPANGIALTPATVAPGEIARLSITMKPRKAGTLGLAFHMRQNRTKAFGETCGGPINVTAANEPVAFYATPLSIDAPETVKAGQSFQARIVMRNEGSKTWTTATSFYLGDTMGQWGPINRVEIQEGQTVTNGLAHFTTNSVAPMTPGTYTYTWQMLNQSEWFGQGITKTIQVTQ